MANFALRAPRLFDGAAWHFEKVVLVSNGRVQTIVAPTEIPGGYNEKVVDGFLAPAFIDVQIYGAFKKLLAVNPEPQTLQLMHEYCTAGGAPLHQPTVATNTHGVFKNCIDAVRAYWAGGGKGVYGLHLEGPWIATEKRGAHLIECIHPPTTEEVKGVLEYGKGVITMITLAPEVCPADVIELIQNAGIVISAGHSNASFAQATAAFNSGIGAATHLYNAMSPLQHRAPGMVGALFQHQAACCSIIPDGHHVDYEAVAIAKKVMGNRLFAITDAVTETADGPYPHRRDGDKYVSNGILSGSALTMHQAFVNLVREVGIDVGEALRMCSLYPAEVLRRGDYGKIAPGYAAQFIVIGSDLNLVEVISE